MRKTLLWCSALLLSITMVFSCSIAGKMPDVNTRRGVDKLESLQNAFKWELKEAIRYAMDEWEKATDGTVRFYEKNLDWWGKIKWGFGIVRNVRIIKDHYGEDNADIRNISHNDILTVKYIYSRISYQEMLDNWQDTKSIILGGR